MNGFSARQRTVLAAALCATLVVACGDKSPADQRQAIQEAIRKGDLSGAQLRLKSAIEAAPESGEFRYQLGLILHEQGDHANAEVELRKALELGGPADAATAALARALVAGGRHKHVTDTYDQVALTDKVAQAELAAALGNAWLAQRSVDKAKAAATAALAAVPEFGPALLIQARVAAGGDRLDESLALIKRASAAGPRKGEAHLLHALLLIRGKRDLPAAVASFEAATQYPESAVPARIGLIQAHLQANDLPKAKLALAKLQESHANHPQTVYFTALLAFFDRDYAKSEALTDALLRQAPNSAPVLVLAGASHLRRGELIAAEAKLGKVVQTTERALAARRLLGETYVRMGNADKALATLKPLLDDRSDAEALTLAAQAHLQKGSMADAEAAFSAAAELKPQDIRIGTSVALADLSMGRQEAAFESLQKLAERDTGHTAALALISAQLHRGKFDAALEAISRLEKKQPSAALPRHLRGLALAGQGDSPAARQAFESALTADPSYFAATSMLVSLDIAARKFDAAQARLEAVVKKEPKNIAARLGLVNVLRAKASPPNVIERVIDDAIRANPQDAGPHLAKLDHVARHGTAKDAAAQAQVALAALPDQPQLLDAAGRALAAAGDHQQALSVFSRLASAAPRSPQPYLRLAELQAIRGQNAASVSMLNRAFEVAPRSPEVHRRLLENASRTRDYKTVLSAAKDLQRNSPQSALGYLLEGSAEASRKAWPAALAAFESAVQRGDGQGQAERSYYVTLKLAGQVDKAKRFAADWLAKHPKDVQLRGLLGSDALAAGRLAEAERYFREIVDIEPRSAPALNNLAWLLAERRDPGALPMAERALALEPQAPEVLDTMAKALEVNGQMDRAIEYQRLAVEGSPNRPAYRLALAGLLLKRGDRDAAAQEVGRVESMSKRPVDQAALAALKAQLKR